MKERMQNGGCGPMLLATAMFVLVVACGITEIGSGTYPDVGEQEGIASPFRPVCCVLGMEYPSGYDWNADDRNGEVKCSLIVFADGVPKIKVPVGDGYEVSSDPDMNRMIDGNLYTFYSKGGQTVMKCNGRPLFRYEADEVLVDMAVRGDDVYTLAHRRSEGGFALRRNGEIRLERLSGETFGGFWDDGDCLCFAFVQPVALPDRMEHRHYIAYDSKAVSVSGNEAIDKVWDIMSYNGTPCILASLKLTGEACILNDGRTRVLEIPKPATMLSGRLFPADSLLGVECMYLYPDGVCESGIWVNGSEYMRFEAGCSIQSLEYKDGRAYCILDPDQGEDIIFNSGDMEPMPDGYFCVNERAMTVHDGGLYVGLSSDNGGYPLVWHEGKKDTLRFNGCISSISFSVPAGNQSSQVRMRD